jgi:aldehyde:ferredoxin oxidoreductase
MSGYTYKILIVDLTAEKTNVKELPKSFCKKFLGGNGFGIKLLYDHVKPGIDPLSPDNVVVFAVGPFLGTSIPTSGKYIVYSKSPLTGFQGESVSSSFWGHSLKMAGYDCLIIKGRAKRQTYLFIDDNIIEFRSARELWGKNCIETERLIREKIGDDNVHVVTIGPAGENLVRFACIYNDGRFAGRTGIGAVLGSKQIKAVAVRGSNTITVDKPDELLDLCADLIERCRNNPTIQTYRTVGTSGKFNQFYKAGIVPINNFQRSTFEETELVSEDIRNISAEYMIEHYLNKPMGCLGCAIACDHIHFIREGIYKNTVVGVKYETIYALGSNCGVKYFPAIAKANELCDKLGLDTISTGVTIAWAMECFENGLFSSRDTGGIDLSFGDFENLIDFIPKIAYREGLGNLLAEGVKRASEKTGKGSKHFAIHSKGLEFPGYDVRGLKATGLAFAVSTRGACHLRARVYSSEIGGKINRFKIEKGHGKYVAQRENLLTLFDSLMLCKFSQEIWNEPYKEFANLYTLVTGMTITSREIRTAGERIYNLEKLFNIREGWTVKDDSLPPRILKEPVPDGVAKGSIITEDELKFLLDDYYAVRGWTKNGIPTKKKLIKLGIDDVSEEVTV